MSSDDWYRNEIWSKSIADTFFEKLARARSQRDQYLVIQALMLAPKEPDTALQLIERYFATRKNEFNDVRAYLARAKAYSALNEVQATLDTYKVILNKENESPTIKTRTCYEYPYLVARLSLESEYPKAMKVAKTAAANATFPIDIYQLSSAQAIILDSQGSVGQARSHANRAIEAAHIKKSGFRYHQSIGLVGREHQDVLKTMVRIAA